ncbi:phosphoglucomutase/phosphomannomutase family protein, partial [bacterium]
MTPIKFGTDGWRGLIAADFTFDNVAKVALATANYFKRHKRIRNGVVIGYDTRFLSREFAETTAEVLANRGIKVILSDKVSSTPMVSLLTTKLKAAGGIVITASHNPARYNGFKIKGDFGGPAHPEMIEKVEKELKKVSKSKVVSKRTFAELVEKGVIKKMDFTAIYVDDLRAKLNLPLIESSGIKIVHDAMYGAGAGVMSQLVSLRAELRTSYNPSFGGGHPEPIPQNMKDLASTIVMKGCDIGIATDGDADRVGALDESGLFVDSHRIFAILLKYLVTEKHLTGEIAKS